LFVSSAGFPFLSIQVSPFQFALTVRIKIYPERLFNSLSALVLLLFVFSSLSMNSFLSASGFLPKADAKVRTFSSYPNFSTTFLQLFFEYFFIVCLNG